MAAAQGVVATGICKPVWLYPGFAQQNLPERWGHSGVYFNGKLYIYGGCRGGLQFSDVLMVDVERMSWTTLVTTGQEPGPRDSHAAVLYDQKMIIFGGTSGAKKTNDVYVLDLNSLVWSRPQVGGLIPDPRESHSATMIDKKRALVFGGSGNGGKYLNDVHILDCESLEWSSPSISGSHLPASRDSHSSVAVGDELYVYGGDCGESYLGELEVLDLQSFTWTKLQSTFPAAAGPGVRAGHSAVAVDDQMFIFGGAGDRVYYEDVWILDVRARAWAQLDAGNWQPRGRFSHVAALTDVGIIVYGGCGGDEKPLNELLMLHLGGRDLEKNWKRMGDQKRAIRSRKRPLLDNNLTPVETLVTRQMWRNDVLKSTLNKSHCTHQFASKRFLDDDNNNNFQQKKLCCSSTTHEESSVSESEQELPVRSSVLSSNPVRHSSCQSSNSELRLQLQCSSPQTIPPKAGLLVSGIVDGVFDSGYLITAHVNGQLLRGVLFHPTAPPDLIRSAHSNLVPGKWGWRRISDSELCSHRQKKAELLKSSSEEEVTLTL